VKDEMVEVTENALEKIRDLLANEQNPKLVVRMFVEGGGCSGFQYKFTMDEDIGDDDFVIEKDGAKFVVDIFSAQYLTGSKVDYKTEKFDSQFVISNPNAKSTCGCGSSFNA
jgi:iron-sulfur cluster insertion protein